MRRIKYITNTLIIKTEELIPEKLLKSNIPTNITVIIIKIFSNLSTIFKNSFFTNLIIVAQSPNKNKGVRLRFEKGNVVDIAGWNKSTKKANPSIKKINNKNVKQTIKVLKRG